jgi:hypothetical protein
MTATEDPCGVEALDVCLNNKRALQLQANPRGLKSFLGSGNDVASLIELHTLDGRSCRERP